MTRLIFAGTPEFAALALDALAAAGHDIALVLTRADREAGRGQALRASPVKLRALQAGFDIYQPRSLRTPEAVERLAAAAADVMVVAAYGLILPQNVLDLPPLGCLNIHASLLPRWRGAAPIQRAIEAGDRETGVTIMQMDAGLDTGAMLLKQALPIGAEANAAQLHDALAALGAQMIVEAVARLQAGQLPATPQPADGMTYASKIEKSEAALDWRLPATALHDRIRAFDPAPGCTATLVDQAGRFEPVALKVWRSRMPAAVSGGGAPAGALLGVGDGWRVACGEGELQIVEVQRAGARRVSVADFVRGNPALASAVAGIDGMSGNCQIMFASAT